MELNNRMKADYSADQAVYTLGITSKLSGIPAHSIRQYIEKGLLIPYKLDSKRHLFSANDVTRLRNIHSLIHDKGLNFAGIRSLLSMIPCWIHMECKVEDRDKCKGYMASTSPCWEASEKGIACKNKTCRECEVYKRLSHTTDLKSLIRELSC